MTIIESESRVTPEELLAMPDGNFYELVDGELVERETGFKSAYISARIIAILYEFTHRNNLGWIVDSEVGFQCFPDDPTRVRKPDITFTRRERLPELPSGNCKMRQILPWKSFPPMTCFQRLSERLRSTCERG